MSSSDVKLPLYHDSEANKGGSLREDTDPRNVTSVVEQKKMWPGELNDFLPVYRRSSHTHRAIVLTHGGVGRVHHYDLDHAQLVCHPPERMDPVSPTNPAAPASVELSSPSLPPLALLRSSAQCTDARLPSSSQARPQVQLVSSNSPSSLLAVANAGIPSLLSPSSPIFLTTFHLVYATIGTRMLLRFTHLLDGLADVQMSWERSVLLPH
jgi:hypothetical protein